MADKTINKELIKEIKNYSIKIVNANQEKKLQLYF